MDISYFDKILKESKQWVLDAILKKTHEKHINENPAIKTLRKLIIKP